jgi:hypothetical protein
VPRLRRLRAQCLPIPAFFATHTEGQPDLDDVPPEPPRRHRRDGLLHRAHRDVPSPSCVSRHPPRPARRAPLRSHHQSDCCLGRAATSRDLSLRVGAALHDLRSRHHLLGRADGDDPVDAHGPTRTSYQSPWQNGVAERFVGTVRRELLDHVIVLNESHLRQLIESFVTYYNVDRTHIGVGKDSRCGRPVEQRPGRRANVVSLPRVGGLYHR